MKRHNDFNALITLLAFAGCWHFAFDPLKKTYIKVISVIWYGLVFFNFVCLIIRQLYTSIHSDLPDLQTVYLFCFGLHVTTNSLTFGINCFKKDGLQHEIDNSISSYSKTLKRLTWIITCFVILFSLIMLTSSTFVTFFKPYSLDTMRQYNYFYIQNERLFHVVVIHDIILSTTSSMSWIGLPALETCILFYFYSEFKRILDKLSTDISNEQVYQTGHMLTKFINDYLRLGKSVKKFDKMFCYATAIGLGLQIPYLCFTFYHTFLSPCSNELFIIFLIWSVFPFSSMIVMPVILEAKVRVSSTLIYPVLWENLHFFYKEQKFLNLEYVDFF